MAAIVFDGLEILESLVKSQIKRKYCDVTVLVDGIRFNCHRVVLAATSGYFDSMFSSFFTESNATEISLTNISSNLFHDILKYMYSGKIIITLKNAYELLTTSDYFLMNLLKDQCIYFIEHNSEVENLFEICIFAYSPAGNAKLREVAIKHAAFNFQNLIQNEAECFLDLEFDLLEIILKQYTFNKRICPTCYVEMRIDYYNNGKRLICNSCKKNSYYDPAAPIEELVFSKLSEWITHDVVKRLKYYPKLMKYSGVDPKCVANWETMFLKYISEIRPSTVVDLSVKKSVHVYALTENHRLVNFLWDDRCWLVHEQYAVPFDHLKGLTIGENQYFLTYKSVENDSTVGQFWVSKKQGPWSELRSPPIVGRNNTVTSVDNSIYLYVSDETPTRNYETVSYVDFKPETGPSRIYTFIPNLNQWFKVPSIPKFLYNSYFVGVGEKLFVIGGTTTPVIEEGTKQEIVQLFDLNTSKWSQKSMNVKLALEGSVCCSDNKIFICETTKGRDDNKISNIHVYDTITDSWQIERTKENASSTRTLVPINDGLWIIPQKPSHVIETYDLKLKSWNTVPDIPSSVTVDHYEDIVVSLLDALNF